MGHDDASMEGQAMTDQERTELLRACARLIDDFKRRYDVDGKVGPVQQDAHSVASALQRLLAEQSSVRGMSGAFTVLKECAETFRHYEELHLVKGTEEGRLKAAANAAMAERCEEALSAHPQEQAAPAEVEELLAAVTGAHPQAKNNIRKFVAAIRASARNDALEVVMRAVAGSKMIGPSPIGPLHGAGWNGAVEHIEASIRALKSSAPAIPSPPAAEGGGE